MVARGLIKAGWFISPDIVHIVPVPAVEHVKIEPAKNWPFQDFTPTRHQTTQSE